MVMFKITHPFLSLRECLDKVYLIEKHPPFKGDLSFQPFHPPLKEVDHPF